MIIYKNCNIKYIYIYFKKCSRQLFKATGKSSESGIFTAEKLGSEGMLDAQWILLPDYVELQDVIACKMLHFSAVCQSAEK